MTRTTISDLTRLLAPVLLAASPACGETLRIATWNVGLDRSGPGLLVRDLAEGTDPQAAAVVRVLVALDADVILLTSVDYDRGGVALRLLADRLAAAGMDYPHRFAVRPNTGMQTGFDIDGNGRPGDARDAQGFGLFSGNAGMAVLSRLPPICNSWRWRATASASPAMAAILPWTRARWSGANPAPTANMRSTS